MAELDEEQSRAVVHTLGRCTMFESAAPIRVWRELVNGRWLVFMTYGPQTYCLLPPGRPARPARGLTPVEVARLREAMAAENAEIPRSHH